MQTNLMRSLSILTLIALIMTHTARVNALSMKPYSLKELWSESQLVIKGKVIQTRAYRDRGRIFTEVTLNPTSSPYKGKVDSKDQLARFSLPGGQLGNLVQRVPGIPIIYTGEELVLFLRCTPMSTCTPVGYGQGMWRHLNRSWTPLTQHVHWVGTQTPLTTLSLEKLTSPH